MKTRIALLTLVSVALIACSGTGGKATHIEVAQTPAAVKAGFEKEFPGLVISHTDQITMPDHTMRYELKFRDAANAYHRKIFTAEGVLVEDKANVIIPAKPY